MDNPPRAVSTLELIARSGAALLIALSAYSAASNYGRSVDMERELRDQLREAQERAATLLKQAEEKKPKRFPVEGMGAYLSGVSVSNGNASLEFANVSPRSGHLCLFADAVSDRGGTARSVPTCALVAPYAVTHMSFSFAFRELKAACEDGGCRVVVQEAKETTFKSPE